MKIKSNGFTLLELAVAAGVIGALAILAVIAFQSAADKARDSQRVSELKQVVVTWALAQEDGVVLCVADASEPCSSGKLLHECRLFENSCNGEVLEDVTSNYLAGDIPQDPKWAVPCTEDRRVDCGYTYFRFENLSDFDVAFSTANNDVLGTPGGRMHMMTQNGEVN